MGFLVTRACQCCDCCGAEFPQLRFFSFGTEREAREFINRDCAGSGFTAIYTLRDQYGVIVESRFPVLMVA